MFRNPKISSETFDSFIQGFKRVRISDLRSAQAIPKDGFVTAGVIVGRDIRKSASGKDYVIWKLHDLKNCQEQPIRLLLFGDAYKEHWKSQVGVCAALVNPHVADEDKPDASKNFKPSSSGVTLKAFKRAEIIELGVSSDLGMCKGVKFGGQKCGNFVNTSLSEFCVHHIMNEARKLSANRGAFNSVTSQPPIKRAANPIFMGTHSFVVTFRNTKFNAVVPAHGLASNSDTMHPTTSNVKLPAEQKTTTKVEEKAVLKEIISDRAHMLGARNLIAVVESKTVRSGAKSNKTEDQVSMADFIKNQETREVKPDFHMPKLGYGLRAGQEISLASKKADAAKVV
ncbi:unnamed protein product [Strongylus vulgaris]|uniref:Uncharacterized protein n=1 Tax=Strongylus vulgaris TaxID=40348 RepID=A0A3P7I7G2_STRVU|nr:unnamed protein product [Strongylus vulgaris]